ncbi:MAG TPA: DUF4349 domain-containing protein [Marmoricola sp.]|nr:DUF4349 domain-containing protein [Marmoricola sp.]
MRPRHRFALVLLTSLLTVALAGCGSGGSSDNRSSAENSAASTRGAQEAPSGTAAKDSAGSAAAKPAADRTIERAVIATAALRVAAKDLTGARQDAINLVTGLRGLVADEQSLSDSRGRLDRVDLTLRVPAPVFGQALDGLGELGTVLHRQQSVEDVTTQVIDIDARVKAQRASVESIQRLLSRATSIGDIMTIERELASRQADLDSLEQQQKYLADQTSLSTIQLTLTRPAATHQEAHAGGFLGGLSDGWHALGRTAVALGMVLGAVLPFLAVLALLAGPVVLLVRRRRAAAPPAPTVEA